MKTGTVQNLTALSLLAFILIVLPVQTFAADQDAVFDSTVLNSQNGTDHKTLAQYYRHQVDTLQAKIEDQIDALNHKPRSSFFGRNGQHIKKHVEFKIHQYEMAIADSMEKAEYHQKMAAEQSIRPASVPSGRTKS
jgi:low affinity Fe/Cu permease